MSVNYGEIREPEVKVTGRARTGRTRYGKRELEALKYDSCDTADFDGQFVVQRYSKV